MDCLSVGMLNSAQAWTDEELWLWSRHWRSILYVSKGRIICDNIGNNGNAVAKYELS